MANQKKALRNAYFFFSYQGFYFCAGSFCYDKTSMEAV